MRTLFLNIFLKHSVSSQAQLGDDVKHHTNARKNGLHEPVSLSTLEVKPVLHGVEVKS